MADEFKHAVVWKNLLLNGTDYCALWQTGEGWLLKGTAAGALQNQRPIWATYEVHCDDHWLTRRVEVVRTMGAESKSLRLTVADRRVWHSSGQELPAVQGCEDVDLALTPATNTLPIRRLVLAVGESASVIAAWVQFPELTVQPLSQRYTRISRDKYRYESDTGFAADIGVDDLGLVTNYTEGGSGWPDCRARVIVEAVDAMLISGASLSVHKSALPVAESRRRRLATPQPAQQNRHPHSG